MSRMYSKAEIIKNIRNIRSLNELKDLAKSPRSQVYAYASKEAKAEIKRRTTGKTKIKVKKNNNPFKLPSMDELMRL